ncbi:hypothetical protein [Streptomyces roseoviridis]|uniref:DUF317 domain-containing protein n=1 Tax=Streptomyces roseoviridis TaxID=67361 RepID=A0ABV5QYU6_9ACTN
MTTTATPAPTGYTVPPAAAKLLAAATAAGWRTLSSWTPATQSSGGPSLTVQVGRLGPNGRRWHYKVVWHARGCAPGRVRLFSSLASTPTTPQWHNGPSLKAIHIVISQHPQT